MKKVILAHIVFLMLALPLSAQVVDSVATDSSSVQLADSVVTSPRDTLKKPEKKKQEPGQISPWKEQAGIGTTQITNDSLLRWQILPNWGDYYAYRKDVISFRQGTIGRVDAFDIGGYTPIEQTVEMEGLVLNHPLTGLPDYNLVPHRKIKKVYEAYQGHLETKIQLRDFYVVKPISYLNYDEAGGDYRNLEFLVSQNFSEATNLEISYWDRKGGGYYPNNGVSGSQAFARVYHHLNDKFLLRAMYLRNQMDRNESFGYVVGDPLAFTFDEFTSIPNKASANSKSTRWDLVTGIYQRADSSSSEIGGLEFSITKNKRDLFFAPDTLNHHLRSLNGRAFRFFEMGKFRINADLRFSHHSALENTPVSVSSWVDLKGEAKVKYQFLPKASIFAGAIYHQRGGDGFGSEIFAGLTTSLFDRISFNTTAALYDRIPSIQSLYWNQGNYEGNSGLLNESGMSITGKLTLDVSKKIKLGGSGRIKFGENATFITPDSSFANSGSFTGISASAFGRFENHRFEFETSGVLRQNRYDQPDTPLAALNHLDYMVWIRNSGFIKGYVFDRAAYLKLGVKTLVSPFYYSSRTYNTELDYWQGNSQYQQIPSFFRLDAELSARVRGIMVVMRWENALDGLGQAGYFEAAGFPMPPRRLIVGIRAQFRN